MTLSWPVIAKHEGDRKAKNDIVLTGRIYDLDREKIISKLDEKGGGLQRLKRLKY